MKKLNVSIDDISPHPKSSVAVLDRCFDLINVFPCIKFTLFVPMAYTRIGERSYKVRDFPNFCKVLNDLPKDNFEMAWHGFYHGITGRSNNDEFAHLSCSEASNVLFSMFEEAGIAGIKHLFKPIFRPSAFRMSPHSFKSCSDLKISTLALSNKRIVNRGYGGEDKRFSGKVVYYNINPPFDPLKVYDNMEIVYHACEWDKNYLDIQKKNDLIEFIGKTNDIDFVFIGDM